MGTSQGIGHNTSYNGVSKSAAEYEDVFTTRYFDADASNNITITGPVYFDNTETKMYIRTNGNDKVYAENFWVDDVELTNGTTINGQSNRENVLVSDWISSGQGLIIPSGFWVWSDTTATAALVIDIPCTIYNYGKIIGRGGDAETNSSSVGQPGGPAISINSGVSNVTIENMSGAYIAGGGGGGNKGYSSAGGGAGGGHGGPINQTGPYGDGGVLNAAGENGQNPYNDGNQKAGQGGGAGGGGAGAYISTYGYPKYGGGGGRILPGTGGAGGSDQYSGGAGGSAGNAGTNAPSAQGAGGGGGWGAAGGTSNSYGTASSGGAAILDNGVTYTLSNSGTIYGAT